MKKGIGVLWASAFILLMYSYASAGEADAGKKIDDELSWLQAEAMVFTEIATRTKMDADLVPGMVTVLKGEDLERKGVRTVGDALETVPGLSLGGTRGTAPVMRGIEMTNAYKIKGLLNGVAINASLTGEISPLYFIPIEQVDRIEIIRGPGSAIYGKWAYMGVFNVVMHKTGNRISARYGSHDALQGSLLASYADADDSFKAGLNIGGLRRHRSDIESGPDMPALIGLPSNAPGPVNDARKLSNGVFTMNFRDFYFIGQWTEINFGSDFGLTEALPPLDDRTQISERNWGIEAGWERELSETMRFKFYAGFKEYRWDSGDIWLYPAGFVTPDEDTIGRSYYKDNIIETGVNFHWNFRKSHHLLFGLEYEYLAMQDDDIWMSVNYDPITFEPLPYQRFDGDKNWLDTGKKRHVYSALIQDQFEVNDRLIITGGLRYDQYDDNDNRFTRMTPRLAAVFKASENHIFKIQYAEAFRPPGFMEMYAINNPVYSGNPNLEAETVQTYEAGYIFRKKPFIGKLTAFHSEMKDLIAVTDSQYLNFSDAKTAGAEAEVDFKLTDSVDVNVSISYADTEDKNGNEIKGTIRWLGSASVLFHPLPDWTVGLTYRYADDRFRSPTDARPKLDGFQKTDAALSVDHLFLKGLTLRIGVKNVFDEDIRYPSIPDYPDDYPRPGREYWAQASYRF